jgi:uncharacterized protein HemX
MRSDCRRGDAAFAAVLALVLGVGVLGVLLLNTVMQQQAHRLAEQHDRLAALALEAQGLAATLDRAADPRRLEARARERRLRPAKDVRYVDSATEARRLSERRPAAGRDRAG